MTARNPHNPAQTRQSGAEHVLVVDDEAFVRSAFQLYLETHGYEVSVAESGIRAIEIVQEKKGTIAAALLDLVMPGMYGIDVLSRLKEIDPTIEVVIATGCGNVHSAVEAMRYGAFDYITKPIVDFEQDLLLVVRAAVEAHQARCRQSENSDPEADAPTVRAVLTFYQDLENLAARRAAPAEFSAGFSRILGQHFEAEGALVLVRQPGALVECRQCWESAADATDQNATAIQLAHTALWDELEAAEERWTTLHFASTTLEYLPLAKPLENGESYQALKIQLAGQEDADGEAAALVLLRRGATEGSPTALPTALLSGLLERGLAVEREPKHAH